MKNKNLEIKFDNYSDMIEKCKSILFVHSERLNQMKSLLFKNSIEVIEVNHGLSIEWSGLMKIKDEFLSIEAQKKKEMQQIGVIYCE